MVELYNLTNVTESENLLELTESLDGLTGGWLSIMILVSFFIILIAGFRGQHISIRLSIAGFLTTIISMIFRVTNIMKNETVIIMFVLITAGSYVASLYINQN